MYDIEKTIKHFESLQKRYTTEHNGKMCERVADALEALKNYTPVIHAHWVDGGDLLRCSNCNYGVNLWNNTKCCPNCGAKMIEVK